jgi:hypothetical protein
MIVWAEAARAQYSTPFQMLGAIQRATIDVPGDRLSAGTIQIEGITVIVPANTIVRFPNALLTWQDVFTMAPAPYGPSQSGLALADIPVPIGTVQAELIGNKVGTTYIAGLVSIQQAVNNGQGVINAIDYVNGELHVGGTIGDLTTGARVQLNDPLGTRFGRLMSPDPRFTIDEDNPSVRATTGFPMCLPRTTADDPLCPQGNRPIDPATGTFRTIFTMPSPVNGVLPDARIMAPFEVGDYVTYSGLLATDARGGYVSADTIIADLGIYTSPGVVPAYVAIDVAIIGVNTNGILPMPMEVTLRTRYIGFTTDPSRNVSVFAIDVDPCSGSEVERFYGSATPATGAPRGRWRFLPGRSTAFLPPTREVRARSLTGELALANGLTAGQYKLPNQTYVFPEHLDPGGQPVPLTFDTIPFLVNGLGPYAPGRAGQLNPFPVTQAGPPPNPVICPLGPPAPKTVTAAASGSFLPAPTCDALDALPAFMANPDKVSLYGKPMISESDPCAAIAIP